MKFSEYASADIFMCGLQQQQKGPGYNGWSTTPIPADAIDGFDGAGILHVFSKTCALDIDDMLLAEPWMLERGVDLGALLDAPKAVRIESGRPGRSKLLYRLAKPLRTLKPKDSGLEFRCATAKGTSVQDVLPDSVHPLTGKPYRWVGDWRNIPDIPDALQRLWTKLLHADAPTAVSAPSMTLDELRKLVALRDPNCGYDEWLKIGMALHHESRGAKEGLALWCEWSKKATRKAKDGGSLYPGDRDLNARWLTFRSDPGKALVTGASLRVETPATADEFQIEEGDERPVISLVGGELHKYAVQCEQILADTIFVRERQLVRIGGANELATDRDAEVRREDAQAVIIPASVEYLRRRLNERAHFQVYRRREKEFVRIDCPKDVVFNIAGQGDWRTFRKLTTIARAPFIRPDGSICETPGYDAASGVYYQPNADFPSVPVNPTRDDAKKALQLLLAPFDEFPFVTEAARSAFGARILTESVRVAIDTSPAFLDTASAPGAGKTLGSEMAPRIVHGCGPAQRPWPQGAEELRKALFASLLAGDRTIGFDNLGNGVKVRSSILCAFLTADTYSDRRLGASDVPSVPNRSVVSLTGNNITPVGDLARRSIVIRLDADTTDLRGRRFRIPDLRAHVAANRPALLIAALTILRAHSLAGSPSETTPLPSFEKWSRFARDPLIWLGMADPVSTQDDEAEDEVAPLGEAFRLIAEHPMIGEKEFTAADLAQAVDPLFDGDPLRAAIEGAGCSAATDVKRIGWWLREMRDRNAGGFKLVRCGKAHGAGHRWRLRRVP